MKNNKAKTVDIYDPTDFIVDLKFMKFVCKAVMNDLVGIRDAIKDNFLYINDTLFERIIHFAESKYLIDSHMFDLQGNATMAGYCRFAHHVIETYVKAQDITEIMSLTPKWFEKEQRWGWTAKFCKKIIKQREFLKERL